MSKQYKITVNGKTYDVLVEEVDSVVSSAPVVSTPKVVEESKPQVVQNTAPVASAPTTNAVENKVVESSGNCTDVKAQIPGTVVAYKVAVGDSVSEGQVLLILEAMKMESEIMSPVSGTVKAILADKGTSVVDGQVLLQIG